MNWQPAEIVKPKPYTVVLLCLNIQNNGYTTSWWADQANNGKGKWIGLGLNQSPPVYSFEDWAVKYWCEIEAPLEKGE